MNLAKRFIYCIYVFGSIPPAKSQRYCCTLDRALRRKAFGTPDRTNRFVMQSVTNRVAVTADGFVVVTLLID